MSIDFEELKREREREREAAYDKFKKFVDVYSTDTSINISMIFIEKNSGVITYISKDGKRADITLEQLCKMLDEVYS